MPSWRVSRSGYRPDNGGKRLSHKPARTLGGGGPVRFGILGRRNSHHYSASLRPCPACSGVASRTRGDMTQPLKRVGIPANLSELVGRTPLVRFTRLREGIEAEVIGKLEARNPAGSVKDRIGIAMIEAAEAEGRIEPERSTIIESTSGNTGIALAFVCAAKGYRLIVTMPQGMSRERAALLRLYGAKVIITESMGGMHEAVDEANRLARETAGSFLPQQ